MAVTLGAPKRAPLPQGPDVSQSMRTAERRLKMLEERLTNMRSKVQITEQNMIQKNKIVFDELRTFGVELTEMKKDIQEVKEKVLWIVKELQGFAKREQTDMLKKYIDFWNPIKFVTKREVEAIVREVIDRMRRE